MLDWLIGKRSKHLTVGEQTSAPNDRWYRLKHGQNKRLLLIMTEWNKDWKTWPVGEGTEHGVSVAGATFAKAKRHFISTGGQPDFRIYLEPDRKNRKEQDRDKGVRVCNGSWTQTHQTFGLYPKRFCYNTQR